MDIHIIDDDKLMRAFLVDVMESLNYQTRPFACPGDYLKYMGSTDYVPPKLGILSDVNMPIMSGYELMAAVRKVYPQQRFVIFSGAPDEPTQNDTAYIYLAKPMQLAALEEVLQGFYLCNENGENTGVIGCEAIDNSCDFCLITWECPQSGGETRH